MCEGLRECVHVCKPREAVSRHGLTKGGTAHLQHHAGRCGKQKTAFQRAHAQGPLALQEKSAHTQNVVDDKAHKRSHWARNRATGTDKTPLWRGQREGTDFGGARAKEREKTYVVSAGVVAGIELLRREK